MLFQGTLDQSVAVRHSRIMAERLKDAGKQVTYPEFERLQHSLSESHARTRMLSAIDVFLDGALKR